MCIRDSGKREFMFEFWKAKDAESGLNQNEYFRNYMQRVITVSYTHLRAHETVLDLVCRLLLEKKKRHPHKTDLDNR